MNITYSNGFAVIGDNDSNYTGEGQHTRTHLYDFKLSTWTLSIFGCIYLALILVAIVGNVVVIWTVLGRPDMRTVTNYFLLNLAFADFINVTLNVPFVFVYVANGNTWYFGTAYCKIMTFLGNCVLSAIVFTFMSIAVERYMAIMFPLKARMSKRVSIAVLLATWIASAVIASPPAVLAVADDESNLTNDSRTLCEPKWPELSFQHYYDVTLLAVNYGLPLSVLCLAYTRVSIVLWRQDALLCEASCKNQTESIKVKRKVVRMMITLVVVFAVAWLPMHSYFVATYTGTWYSDWAPTIYICAYWLAMSTSAINPCIYFAHSKRFRAGLFHIFRFIPSCRERARRYEMARNNAKIRIAQFAQNPLTRLSSSASGQNVSRGRGNEHNITNACMALVSLPMPMITEASYVNGNKQSALLRHQSPSLSSADM